MHLVGDACVSNADNLFTLSKLPDKLSKSTHLITDVLAIFRFHAIVSEENIIWDAKLVGDRRAGVAWSHCINLSGAVFALLGKTQFLKR